MIKSPPTPSPTPTIKDKKCLEVYHKKQLISISDHKAAKIFVQGLGFSKDTGLQL